MGSRGINGAWSFSLLYEAAVADAMWSLFRSLCGFGKEGFFGVVSGCSAAHGVTNLTICFQHLQRKKQRMHKYAAVVLLILTFPPPPKVWR